MLTIASRVDVMNRLAERWADPTRSRILLSLLDGRGYPGALARELEISRSNVSNRLSCLPGCGRGAAAYLVSILVSIAGLPDVGGLPEKSAEPVRNVIADGLDDVGVAQRHG